MPLKFRLCILVQTAFLSVYTFAYSQQQFNGKVINSAGEGIESANVYLYKIQDSILKFAVTDKKGYFTIDLPVAISNGFLSVVSVGYQKASVSFSVERGTRLDAIVLKSADINLKEVQIVEKKPLIQVSAGKITLNVAQSILGASNSAFDILQRAPSIQLDNEDVIRLNGRSNILFQVNGTPVNLSQEELATLLKTTSGSTIDKIEIISNPSSNFDASGSGGVINLVLKKTTVKGINGSVSTGVGVSKFSNSFAPNYRSNAGLMLNYKSAKLNIFGSYNFLSTDQLRASFLDRKTTYKNVETNFIIDYLNEQSRYTNTLRTGLDYAVSPKSSIGFLVTTSYNMLNYDKLNFTDIYHLSNLDSSIITSSQLNRKLKNLGVNINYKYNLTNRQVLSADLDYLIYNRSSVENLQNTFLNNATITYRDNLLLRNSSPSNYYVSSFKMDYLKALSSKAQLSMGLKSSLVKSANNLNFGRLLNEVYIPNYLFTNQFDFKEYIQAGYLNVSKTYKTSNLTLALRAEYTYNTSSIQKLVMPPKKYIDFFPNLQFTQQINEANQLLISASRRIDRPNYDDLNPFLGYLDQYNYRSGNVNLNPQYTNILEATHSYKKLINTAIRVSYTTNPFYSVFMQNDSTKIIIASKKNLGKSIVYGASFYAPINIAVWWNANFSLDAMYQVYKYQSDKGNLNNQGSDIIFKLSNAFRLQKGVNAELFGSYEAPSSYGIYKFDAFYRVDAGLSKAIMKNKLNLRLSLNDILNSAERFNFHTNFQNLNLQSRDKNESRYVQLTVNYLFGKQSNKSVNKHQTGAETEQKRIGNNN